MRAGTHTVRVARADGTWIERSITIAAHSRGTVVIDARAPATAPPKTSTANFNDDPTDPPEVGSPPAVKHPSLLPCKYDGCDTHSGDEIADPLADGQSYGSPVHAWRRIGIRGGGVVADHGGDGVGPSLAVVGHVALPWWNGIPRSRAHPIDLDVRLIDWSERGGGGAKLDVLGSSVGVDRVMFSP